MNRTEATMDDLPEPDWSEADKLSDEEVMERALADPDAQPLTPEQLSKMRRVTNVRLIRHKLNMTQEQFADAFQLSVSTLRDWEQQRTLPDQAARTLLRVIAHDPDFVQKALAR